MRHITFVVLCGLCGLAALAEPIELDNGTLSLTLQEDAIAISWSDGSGNVVWTDDRSLDAKMDVPIGYCTYWIKPGSYNFQMHWCGTFDFIFDKSIVSNWNLNLTCP